MLGAELLPRGEVEATDSVSDEGRASDSELIDLDLLGLSSEDEISLHWTWSEEVEGNGLLSLDLSLEVDTSSLSLTGTRGTCG